MTSTETAPMAFRSTVDIERAMDAAGSHWWDADTLRFFGTRIPNNNRVYGGRVFVASHQPPHGPRLYAVHVVERVTEQRESDGRTVTRYSIQNAVPILDSPATLRPAVRLAEYLGHRAEQGLLPEAFDYDQSRHLEDQGQAFLAGAAR